MTAAPALATGRRARSTEAFECSRLLGRQALRSAFSQSRSRQDDKPGTAVEGQGKGASSNAPRRVTSPHQGAAPRASALSQTLSEELKPKCRLETKRSVRAEATLVVELHVGAQLVIAVLETPPFHRGDESAAHA